MFEELKALLVEKFLIDEKEITPDAELAADLGINSIELAELLDSSTLTTTVTFRHLLQSEILLNLWRKTNNFRSGSNIRSETENSICFLTFLRSV